MRPIKLGQRGKPAIAAPAGPSRPRDRANGSRRRIDEADGVVLGIDDQKIACPIDRQFLGPVERRLCGRAAVARVALGACAGNCPDQPGSRIDGPE